MDIKLQYLYFLNGLFIGIYSLLFHNKFIMIKSAKKMLDENIHWRTINCRRTTDDVNPDDCLDYANIDMC